MAKTPKITSVDDGDDGGSHADVVENFLRAARSMKDWIDLRTRARKPGTKYQPTDRDRLLVMWACWAGMTHKGIAEWLGMHPDILREHFREELDFAVQGLVIDATKSLAAKAFAGDTTALLFILRARGGDTWKDKQPAINVSVAEKEEVRRVAADPQKIAEAVNAVAQRVLQLQKPEG